MDSMLRAMQDTQVAIWVREAWGYPFLLVLHSLGFAIVVGFLIVIDLRILGLGREVPLPPLRKLMLLVWSAFTVNTITGAMLFTSDAIKFFYSPAFRFKLLFIVAGVVLAAVMTSTVLEPAERNQGVAMVVPMRAKVLAAASIVLWIAAIGLGRYVAYEQ
jgi:hypothetical protein